MVTVPVAEGNQESQHGYRVRMAQFRFGAVVFDFDGLLMDTESTLVEGWRAEWAAHGLTLDLDDGFWPGHGGNVTQHRLDRLAALVGPGFDRAASLARFAATRRRLHESMQLCPGIGQWLVQAKELGLRCAVYLVVLRRLGIRPARAVAVEDTPHGIAAARAAGMTTVAIPNPFVDTAAVAAADLILPSAAQVPLGEVLTRLPLRSP